MLCLLYMVAGALALVMLFDQPSFSGESVSIVKTIIQPKIAWIDYNDIIRSLPQMDNEEAYIPVKHDTLRNFLLGDHGEHVDSNYVKYGAFGVYC